MMYDRKLEGAKQSMEKIIRQGWVKRMINRGEVSDQLTHHKTVIGYALNTFIVRSRAITYRLRVLMSFYRQRLTCGRK